MSQPPVINARHSHQISRSAEHFAPGITLVAVITCAAYGLRQLPGMSGVSPMISAILVGMIFANYTTVPAQALPGVNLFGKKALRCSVALLGLQLTFNQVHDLGLGGFVIVLAIVASTYFVTLNLGRLIGVDPNLTRLLAAGCSICGASAIAAANSVEKSPDQDVAYAVAAVTLFGSLAMLTYPLLGRTIGLGEDQYGYWIGSSVHEVAQVVAAGFQWGQESGEQSVVVKLTRVLLLAPLLLGLGVRQRVSDNSAGSLRASQIVPVFVLAFISAIAANSLGIVPTIVKNALIQITPIMLTASLGAIGLSTRLIDVFARGWRPMFLAGGSSLYIAVVSLAATYL